MAEEAKKTIPVYVPLSTIGMSKPIEKKAYEAAGKRYIEFHEKIISILVEFCSRGKISLKTATEIEIMDDTDIKKRYLQRLVNIVKDKTSSKKVQYNLVSFGKLIIENRIVIEQAFVDNRMLNWVDIFTSLADENFSFDDSSLAVLLLKERKRIEDEDKKNGIKDNGMSK